MFTLVVLNDILLEHINSFLVSSAPSDGTLHAVKCRISIGIVEPLCEILYSMGLTTVKPVAAMTVEDLLCGLEIKDHNAPKN